MKAWGDSLGGINYPLLCDFWPHGHVADQYGVLRGEGYSERAIFIVDKDGIIRYIDVHDIENQPSNAELFDVIAKFDPDAKAQVQEMKAKQPEELPHGGVVMYCTPWCIDCRLAKTWLKERNIPYTEVNIHENPAAAEQVMKWANGNKTTPTFDIDGTIVVDFDKAKLEEIFKNRS